MKSSYRKLEIQKQAVNFRVYHRKVGMIESTG
ncbi:hypothetical protein E2C01_094507 [Portunus trituberculatus]|uniref:Uncharacterized protein n=1 Tax=Portunus trituberculatus TaxID=210409 RepID=A0A5B7JMB3_PORTR|nr:hypothetical protein [Portunus trituberculatus]